MSDPGCDRQVREAQARLDELTRRVGRIAEQEPLVGEAMRELSTALQELRAAADELQQQNEELAEARELVEEERRRYQDLFDDAPDGYLVTDPHGTIQQANEVAARLLGVRRDFLAGKPLIVFVAREAHRPFAAYLATLQDGHPDRISEWQTMVQPRRSPVSRHPDHGPDPQPEWTARRPALAPAR
jgi:PAS domain S-box-containing protein